MKKSSNSLIPQDLPRKLKKAIYGTKGRRKHLYLVILENKKCKAIIQNAVNFIEGKTDKPLHYFLNKISEEGDAKILKECTWNTKTKKK